ncbi:MFS transporter [Ktedonosporobacter rubrisoli]|uniref:MFS transporter n=1 Tax=Ktedonosporobacter rubrisoli TaxID=2509675 RepID=A0A4P6JZD2_KTERU|nr:MFS transporter [Ktedonosporobacter rubrisoli]QBD81094.1 MFS transporter [Ktedonosporobacter rubrisoli]
MPLHSNPLTPLQANQEKRQHVRRWWGLGVVLLATFVAILDVNIVNVAIPSIQQNLRASLPQIELVVAGYTFPYGLALIAGGRLGDVYGIRRFFLLGVILFTLCSALCALAPSPEVLIATRVGQAIGAALFYPQVLSFIQVGFPGPERRLALSLWGAAIGLASTGGQLLGGLLILANIAGLGWRLIFLINVPLGLLTILGAAFFLFEHHQARAARLDVRGLLILTLGLLLLFYPLIEGRAAAWPWWMLLCFPISLLILLSFGWYERRVAARGQVPLVEPALGRKPSFILGNSLTILFFATNMGLFFTLPLYLQDGLHFTAIESGLFFTPLALGFTLSSALASRLVAKIGSWVLMLAFGLTLLGFLGLMVTLLLSGAGEPAWIPFLLLLALTGIGQGLGIAPLFSVTLAGIAEHDAGVASGVLETSTQMSYALGVALIGIVFFSAIGGEQALVTATRSAFTHAFIICLLAISGCALILLFVTPLLIKYARS